MALAGLCKFTFLTAGFGVIGLLCIEDLWRKRVPRLGIWFVVLVVLLWRVTGQSFLDIPAYLVNSWRLADGYSQAMGVISPDYYMLGVYAVIAGFISLLVLARFWQEDRLGAVLAFLSTAGMLFICFKEGFVRHDGHERLAMMGLQLIAKMCAPVLWLRWGPRAPLWGVWVVRTLVCAVLASSIYCLGRCDAQFFSGNDLWAGIQILPTTLRDRSITSANWILKGDQIFDAEEQQGLAKIRADYALPDVKGTTDMYGLSQFPLIAAGVDYVPRPVEPGFQCWLPELIGMNRRSLVGERAPENIFFMPEAIDDRFHSLEDGALWPYILTRYTPTELTTTGYLVMHRSPVPRSFTLTPLLSGTFHIGQTIAVPPISSGAIWMKIRFKRTFLGKLETMVLRAPPSYIDFSREDGHPVRARIIPGMTEDGFVLSPVVSDAMGFLSLMVHDRHLANVTSVAINVPSLRLVKNFFDPDIEVEFDRLDIPTVSMADTPDLESLVNLGEMGFTTNYPAGTCTFLGTDGKFDLFSHPPARLQLALPEGARQIHVGGGIRPAAWDNTNGVLFIVWAIGKDGASHQIYSRAMQPRTQPKDRGQFEADLQFPPDTSRLEFETRAVSTLDYCWAYWSNVRFQHTNEN